MMRIDIEPTPEMYDAPINGQKIPVRIWRGFSDNGVALEAYVLSITPDQDDDTQKLRDSLPFFMVPSRVMYRIDATDE
jgi:hypothetical protein